MVVSTSFSIMARTVFLDIHKQISIRAQSSSAMTITSGSARHYEMDSRISKLH